MANKITAATPLSAAGSSEDLVFLDGQEPTEFSYWEFINQSDVDSDTDSLHSVENGFVSWRTSPAPRSADSGGEIETEPVLEIPDAVDTVTLIGVHVDEEEEEMDEEVDEKETDDDAVNDDLVPWGKFGGRQRMRKLGKRFCSKMVNTKRDRYAYVKRGCVRGKRELEMKA